MRPLKPVSHLPTDRPPRRPRRRSPFVLFGIAFLLLLVGPALVRFYVDLLWFQEIEHSRVLLTEVVARVALFAGAAALAFAALFASARRAQRGRALRPVLLERPEAPPLDVTALMRRATLPVALVLALLIGMAASGAWMTVLQAFHATPFAAADPIFGRDISFYVFQLPLIAAVIALLGLLGVLSLAVAAASYWFRGELALEPGNRLRVEPAAGRHLALLGAFLFLLVAAQIWLVSLPHLLYSRTGPLVGASFTDLMATRPGLHASAVAAVAGAVALLLYARQGRLARGAVIAVAGFALVSVVGRGLVPALVQRLVVAPTELTRETPYLAHHIAMTRSAWGLDDVENRELSGAAEITMADIEDNATTVENVRLWDQEPLLQTFGQLQEIRTYYDFVSVDDDRYWIDGRYRQVLLSARELNSASLPTRTFINEHLTFTHGMGVTMAPANQATEEGLPVLFIQDLPPRSNIDLEVTRPQIYYGELTDSYVFVHTRQREFDYPAGDQNVFTRYAGTGGFPVNGFFRRSMLAAYFQSGKILLSGDITSDSRVLYRRNIAQRASRALPFLRFDGDPYLVIRGNGELVWLLDAYTTSTRFPYSAPLVDGTTYMRNSVKVVIDAYDGTVTPYVTEPEDPLIRTYGRIFPGIFRDLAEMPEDLRAHIRYPEDLYRVQMGLYSIFHLDNPEEFYHREDQWQIPSMRQRDREVPFMRRIIMRLPHEEAEEYIFMTPFTPRGRDNLTAWVVARSDGEHYGQLVQYRFPRQSLVFGPRQIVNRINQDTEIARQLTLWDQRGSTVIRGELMVIPIGEGLIYVQPIFLRAEGGRIPEMRRVVVAYENQVVMEENLDRGLTRIFGAPNGVRPERPAVVDETLAAAPVDDDALEPAPRAPAALDPGLARSAREHYERALAAQRAGDWGRYGEEIRRLGEILEELAGEAGGGGS